MENYVKDKVVVITGAGSGFGRITAQKIAELGGKVVISDIVADRVEETVKLVKDAGGQIAACVGDASKQEDVAALVKTAVDEFGRIDTFIANAGTMPLALWAEHEKAVKAWDKAIDINLKGTMYAITESFDQMIAQGQGQIIIISSIMANDPVIGAGVYQATKVGVRWLAETLRREAKGKIKVSVVSPTAVPSTGLNSTIVGGPEALKAGMGTNFEEYIATGRGTDDPDDIKSWQIKADYIVTEGILHCINQPWGVNISDVTVRASNEGFVC